MAPGLPIPPALPPLSAGIRGVASVLEKGPRALAPHADMETPALGSPARPGEQAAVPNYLTGPHSACHAMDHGQERLWGQKRHSLVTPTHLPLTQNSLRVPGALERAESGRRDWPLIGKETSTSPLSWRRAKSALSGWHGTRGWRAGPPPLSSLTPSFPK